MFYLHQEIAARHFFLFQKLFLLACKEAVLYRNVISAFRDLPTELGQCFHIVGRPESLGSGNSR